MALTDDMCEVHKIRIWISLGMTSKLCADGNKCSEHNKQTNVIHFECEIRNVSRTMKYLKRIYSYNTTTVQVENPLGYN